MSRQPTRMHEDELDITEDLGRRLLGQQFPAWSELPLQRIASSGTDHAIFRLGDEMAVRLPRIHWASGQAAKDARWLPKLAPHLPLTVPVPIATGEPGEGYPWHWSIVPWVEGEAWALGNVEDLSQAASDLAGFIRALQRVDINGAPRAGRENFARGVPLAVRDVSFREHVAAAGDVVDGAAMVAAWEEALAAPEWDGEPAWVHGDLSRPGNLIVRDGRLVAVIDFGCLGVGDPACELRPAWSLFSGESRRVFRSALPFDRATWVRARGWALTSVAAIPYYRETNPAIVAEALHEIEEALADTGPVTDG